MLLNMQISSVNTRANSWAKPCQYSEIQFHIICD